MTSFLRVLVRAHHGDLLQTVEFRDVTSQLTIGDVRDKISSAFPTIDNFELFWSGRQLSSDPKVALSEARIPSGSTLIALCTPVCRPNVPLSPLPPNDQLINQVLNTWAYVFQNKHFYIELENLLVSREKLETILATSRGPHSSKSEDEFGLAILRSPILLLHYLNPSRIQRTAQRCEWLLPAALQMAELLIAQLASREGRASTASAAMSASGAGASSPADARITMNRFASAIATATQRAGQLRQAERTPQARPQLPLLTPSDGTAAAASTGRSPPTLSASSSSASASSSRAGATAISADLLSRAMARAGGSSRATATGAGGDMPRPADPVTVARAQYGAALQFLLDSGVEERRASEALVETGGDIDTALAILFAQDSRSH